MKLAKIKIVLTPDAADLLPDILAVGRGADPRGHDIGAWEREEAARLKRLEAKRLALETAKAAKPEAAE